MPLSVANLSGNCTRFLQILPARQIHGYSLYLELFFRNDLKVSLYFFPKCVLIFLSSERNPCSRGIEFVRQPFEKAHFQSISGQFATIIELLAEFNLYAS
jgi:hypothetical protein